MNCWLDQTLDWNCLEVVDEWVFTMNNKNIYPGLILVVGFFPLHLGLTEETMILEEFEV